MIFLSRIKTRPFTSKDRFFDSVACWRWVGLQIFLNKLSWDKFDLDLIPCAALARHEWIALGLGLRWLNFELGIYIPREFLLKGLQQEKEEAVEREKEVAP